MRDVRAKPSPAPALLTGCVARSGGAGIGASSSVARRPGVRAMVEKATPKQAVRAREPSVSMTRLSVSTAAPMNLEGRFALRIRFSAARYSFCSRSSWLTELFTYASSRTYFLFLMPTAYLTLR